ncbi:MAG: hypothetical protein ACK5PS_11990 [Desulfopila sp.]
MLVNVYALSFMVAEPSLAVNSVLPASRRLEWASHAGFYATHRYGKLCYRADKFHNSVAVSSLWLRLPGPAMLVVGNIPFLDELFLSQVQDKNRSQARSGALICKFSCPELERFSDHVIIARFIAGVTSLLAGEQSPQPLFAHHNPLSKTFEASQ